MAISRIERVVSLPTLYLQLVRQIQSVETPIEAIADTVSKDIGMTTEVLRIVNSAFFGLPQPTSSVAEAISRGVILFLERVGKLRRDFEVAGYPVLLSDGIQCAALPFWRKSEAVGQHFS